MKTREPFKEIKEGRGKGYILNNGMKCMEYCFKCGLENYAFCVASGKCAWCGFDANKNNGNKKR